MKILPSFNWWTGIVEDRADPEKLGRYRVRIMGYHTADKALLPTRDLPWGIPMMPVTGASISGYGETPALQLGSTVVGFFADGEDAQQPIIMGSILGKPSEPANPSRGFSDPTGEYPHTSLEGYNGLNESDISRLARNEAAENHWTLKSKRDNRITDIPVARAEDEETSPVWHEPHPRWGNEGGKGDYTYPPRDFSKPTSSYPFNKVTETEMGHVFEIDDTPGWGRIHTYHNSGSFEEYQPSGARVTKIVGENYNMYLNGNFVFIDGVCNVTISGDCRMKVNGNYYQDIEGDVYTTIGGSRKTRINGNDILEVGTDMSTNVKSEIYLRGGKGYVEQFGRDYRSIVGGDSFNIVYGTKQQTVIGSWNTNTVLGVTHFSVGSTSIEAIASVNLYAGLKMNLSTPGVQNISANLQTLQASAGQTIVMSPIPSVLAAPGFQLIRSDLIQTITATSVQSIIGAATQTISSGGLQSIIAGASQNMAVTGAQTITAATRQITGATSHTGGYVVTGILSGTVVQQGTILLGTHKHLGVTTGPGISGLPTP